MSAEFAVVLLVGTTASAAPAPGTLQLAAADYSVAEDAGFVTVEINRVGGDAGELSLDIQSVDGTATAGDDYNGIATPLTLT